MIRRHASTLLLIALVVVALLLLGVSQLSGAAYNIVNVTPAPLP